MEHKPTADATADTLTKALERRRFEKLRAAMHVHDIAELETNLEKETYQHADCQRVCEGTVHHGTRRIARVATDAVGHCHPIGNLH